MMRPQLFRLDADVLCLKEVHGQEDEGFPHRLLALDAIQRKVENTCNGELARRVMLPCETSISESARFSLYHQGKGRMLDHLLVYRGLLTYYRGSEVHNELLHDETVSFATEGEFPESDHAPIAEFELPDQGL